jgi:translocation and assembly module TamB
VAAAHRRGAGPVRAARRYALAAALLLPLGIALLPSTEAGLRVLLALGRASLGEARFTASGISGSLAGGAVIDDLRVTTETLRLHATGLSLRLRPAALLRRELHLHAVAARALTLEPREASPAAGGGLPGAPALPLALRIDDARIDRLALVRDGGRQEFTGLAAALDWPRGGALELVRLRLTSGEASLAAQGRWAVAGPDIVSIALDWRYRVDDELVVAGAGSIAGGGDTLRFTQRLATPLAATLAGRISLAGPVPAWQATFELAGPQQLPSSLAAIGELWLGGRLAAKGGGETTEIDGALTVRSADHGEWRLELALGARGAGAIDLERVALLGGAGARVELGGRVDLARASPPTVDLAGRWTGLRWPFTGDATGESPQGSFTLAGTLDDYRLGAAARLRTEGLPDTDLTLAAHGDPRQLVIESLAARAGDGRATVTGRVAWMPAPDFELRGRWRDLDYRLADGRRVRSRDGSLDLAGTLAAYRAALDAGLQIAGFPQGRVRARAAGTGQGLDVESLALEAGRSRLGGTASLDWAGGAPRAAAELRATAFDPALFAPAWPGRLDFAIRAAGTPDTWSLRVDGLRGQVRGRQLAGAVDLQRAASRLRVDKLDLSAGAATLAAHGALGQGERLAWRIDVPALADLWPEARGRLSASGDLTGDLRQPATAGRLAADGIEVDGYALADLDAAWRLAPGSQGPQTLTVGARGLRAGPQRLDTLDIVADGPATRLAVDLRAALDGLRIDLGWLGRLEKGPAVAGTLVRGRVGRDAQAGFELVAPAPLAVAAQRFEAGRQCWRGAGVLCVQAARAAQRRWEATLETEALQLEALPRFADWQHGALSGRLVVAGQDDRLARAEGSFSLPGQALPRLAEHLPPITHEGLELRLATRERTLAVTGSLAIAAPSAVPVTLRLELSEGPWRFAGWRDWPAQGSLEARIADLAPWAANTEEVLELAGHGEIDLAFSGSPGAPSLRGGARLDVQRAMLPRLGTTIEDLELKLASAGNRALDVTGRLRAGPGSATVDGQLGARATGPWVALRIASERLRVVDLPEASALVSSALELRLARDEARVTGVVDVPEGHFALRKGARETARSADVVVVGAPPSTTPASRLDADVRLRLGDKVTVAAQGFTGRVLGELRITEQPRRPPRASGELRVVDGKFSAYGQTLDIVKARIIYTGQGIADPALDARAERVVRDVTAGLRLNGRISAPRTTLYSKPAMADGEILSYLVIGQPLTRADASDASAMIGAAAALGLRGGNLVTRGLVRSFGLDELQVTGRPADDNVALNIGKYLTPRLYVGYGMGLMDRANTVQLRYLLGERWSLEAETGTRTGADLLYSIER